MKPIWKAHVTPELKTVGYPKNVRCYDNGGKTIDRYTIVFTRFAKRFHYPHFCMSTNPSHPMGVFSRGEAHGFIDKPRYGHLGKKVKFLDLPATVQETVVRLYIETYSD